MKTKILSLFALIFLMSFVSATTIFSDDFNDGNLGGWTVTNNSAAGGSPWNNTGIFAEAMPGYNNIEGMTTLQTTISTSSYETIIVSYDRYLGDFESSDFFNVSWSIDGLTYTILESNSTGDDSSFVPKSFNLLSSANNNANFRLKFDCIADALNDFCRLDNVIIEGTSTIMLSESTICAFDGGVTTNIGNYLKVDIKDITVTDGFGKDEDWLLLDEVEVEIKVENKGLNEYDVDDISLEWGIANDDLTDWSIDFDEIDEFDLKDDDDETFTITFKIDDDDLDMDLDELSGLNYNLVVRATGVVDDDDDLLTVDDTCAADFKEISIYEESNFVILDNIDMPETLSCGETVTVTADVWNIGDRDQDEVSVDIFGRESALGFSKTIEVGDMDAFDRQQISFAFTVPKNIDEKFYALTFEVNDEDGDIYENDFDEDTSKYTVPFKVEGSCGVSAEDVVISAHLESEAKEGEEMVIKATITNNGDELKTFTINAAEFAMWANLVSQDQSTLVLDSGQSKNVLFTFDINKDAVGTQTFFLELVSGDDVKRQPVSVNVEKSRSLLGITGFAIEGASLWGLGILNLVLIIIIIIVAVRIAKRK